MVQEVRGIAHTVTASVTRPADTNSYTAGDVVANSTSAPTIITFSGVTKGALGNTIINEAVLVDSANVSTKPDLELWLFDTTITMDNDNAAFTPTDAELATLVTVIPFPIATFKVGDATSGANGNSVCVVQNLGIPVNTTKSVSDLYGVLVVRNAYAPVSGEKFTIRLKCLD